MILGRVCLCHQNRKRYSTLDKQIKTNPKNRVSTTVCITTLSYCTATNQHFSVRIWILRTNHENIIIEIQSNPIQVLYVAFGGRFGLEYYGNNHRGSPSRRSNDVYEDFYKSRNQNLNYHSRDNYYPRGHQSSSPSPSPSSAFGGFYSYIMVLGAAAFISQRFFGISPYQAIFLVTTLMGRRGGRVYPRRRHDGFGRNYSFRHRRGGMWGR